MKKTILYGGALNPPTNAHLAILNGCIDHARIIGADVWLMPSGPRPDKSIATSPEQRLLLFEALVSDSNDPNSLQVEKFELEQEELTETYITHDYLTKTYPDRLFIWVFGTDSIITMKDWGEGSRLWDELHMLVVSRPGYEVEELPPNANMVVFDTGVMSSTLVRSKIANNEDITNLVPRGVYATLMEILKSETVA